jgi:hypothetical protein
MIRISPRFRIALGAKGLLLLLMALGFVAIGVAMLDPRHSLAVRIPLGAVSLYLALVLARLARLDVADALSGAAVQVAGAEALTSRRAGWSLRLPDGHFAEYVLWNSWEPLQPGRRYTVVLGRRSRVLVARPELE